MKALKPVILVLTVTVLGACGQGGGKGKKANMSRSRTDFSTKSASMNCGDFKGDVKAQCTQAMSQLTSQENGCRAAAFAVIKKFKCESKVQVSTEQSEILACMEISAVRRDTPPKTTQALVSEKCNEFSVPDSEDGEDSAGQVGSVASTASSAASADNSEDEDDSNSDAVSSSGSSVKILGVSQSAQSQVGSSDPFSSAQKAQVAQGATLTNSGVINVNRTVSPEVAARREYYSQQAQVVIVKDANYMAGLPKEQRQAVQGSQQQAQQVQQVQQPAQVTSQVATAQPKQQLTQLEMTRKSGATGQQTQSAAVTALQMSAGGKSVVTGEQAHVAAEALPNTIVMAEINQRSPDLTQVRVANVHENNVPADAQFKTGVAGRIGSQKLPSGTATQTAVATTSSANCAKIEAINAEAIRVQASLAINTKLFENGWAAAVCEKHKSSTHLNAALQRQLSINTSDVNACKTTLNETAIKCSEDIKANRSIDKLFLK